MTAFFSIKRWREKRPLEDEARAHIKEIFTTWDIDDKEECKNLREMQIEVEVLNINLIAHKLQKLSKDMLIEMWLQYLLLFADRKISELEEELLREENEIKYKVKRQNERKEFIKLVEEYKSKFPKAAEELGYERLEVIIDYWLNELRLYTFRDRLRIPCYINDIGNNVFDYLETNYQIRHCHGEFHTPYLSMMCGSGSINSGLGRNI